MRNYFLFVCFFLANYALHSQCIQIDTLQIPNDTTQNQVVPWLGDSFSNAFIITIFQQVRLHKHSKHSEYVVVQSGEGEMILSKDTFNIRAGSVIWIPQNTFHSVKVTSPYPLKVVSIQAPYFDGKDRIIPLKTDH